MIGWEYEEKTNTFRKDNETLTMADTIQVLKSEFKDSEANNKIISAITKYAKEKGLL